MEKPLQEEEIKELEDEIDLAVDRLFVEKRMETGETSFPEAFPELSRNEAKQGKEAPVDFESPLMASLPEPPPSPPPASSPQPPPAPPAPPADLAPSHLKKMDQFEAQLLSLEWEITDEKIERAIEDTKTLRSLFQQREDIGSLLEGMVQVMDGMKADQTRIHPSMITLLLDGKETLKLLLRKEEDPEFTLYQKLALDGFNARFTLLQQERRPSPGSDPEHQKREAPIPVLPPVLKEPDEIPSRYQAFLDRAEDLLQRIDQRLREMERKREEPPLIPAIGVPSARDITVFKACGKLYGVASESVMKVLKVPVTFHEKYAHLPRIRIREEEVTLVDLPRILPEESWSSGGVRKLLMIRGEKENKGVMAEEVLKRLRIVPESSGEAEKPWMGKVHWVHETHPVEIPILDPERL